MRRCRCGEPLGTIMLTDGPLFNYANPVTVCPRCDASNAGTIDELGGLEKR